MFVKIVVYADLDHDNLEEITEFVKHEIKQEHVPESNPMEFAVFKNYIEGITVERLWD